MTSRIITTSMLIVGLMMSPLVQADSSNTFGLSAFDVTTGGDLSSASFILADSMPWLTGDRVESVSWGEDTGFAGVLIGTEVEEDDPDPTPPTGGPTGGGGCRNTVCGSTPPPSPPGHPAADETEIDLQVMELDAHERFDSLREIMMVDVVAIPAPLVLKDQTIVASKGDEVILRAAAPMGVCQFPQREFNYLWMIIILLIITNLMQNVAIHKLIREVRGIDRDKNKNKNKNE